MSVVNFNDTTPTAPTGFTNGKWQSDSSGNISLNYPLVPNSRIVGGTANDNVSVTDQYLCYVPTAAITVNLPVTPLTNQVLIIRNAQGTYNITLNGNGNNVNGTPTYVLYAGAGITLIYDSSITNWRAMAYVSSAWNAWAPTISGTGSMTVSGPVVQVSEWQWNNANTVLVRFATTFTAGGTAAAAINVSAPILPLGSSTVLPMTAIAQAPADTVLQTSMFVRPDSTVGFFVRRQDGANFALGAWNIQFDGFYRIV